MTAAARRLNAAYAALGAARAELAAASIVGHLPFRGHVAHALRAAHRDRLLAMPGVLGVGLGLGSARQPVISVFVQSEETERGDPWDELSRRQFGVAGRPVGVQIVEFGGLRAVPEPLPTRAELDRVILERVVRLAPGDGIGQIDPATRATLGAFAVTADQAPVAITAMHVASTPEVRPGDAPVPLVRRTSLTDPGARFGQIDRGTQTSVDAARVRLDDGVDAITRIPTIGEVRGWRWPAYPGDIGEGVRLYGASSGRLDGAITQVDVDFPEFALERTIVVSIPTDHGDSGAALVDSSGYVLGFLVGASNQVDSSLRLFSPAGLVLDRLDCNIR